MKLVTPKVYIIAKTTVQHVGVGNWLTDMGVTYDINTSNSDDAGRNIWLKHNYPQVAPDGTLLTTLAGKRCYMSYQVGAHNRNLTKVRTDMGDFCANILETMHGSVLEHTNYTFAIENVSRVFTAEFNRHRAGMAVSEGSMRYIRYDDISYWIPDSIQAEDDDTPELSQAKKETRAIFAKAFGQMEDNYAELLKVWDMDSLTSFKEKKKLTSLFRRIIGMGVATGGVWTGNLRALRHIFTMRCDPSAEEEIIHVASMMLELMIENEPDLFGDFEKVDGYYKPRHRKV